MTPILSWAIVIAACLVAGTGVWYAVKQDMKPVEGMNVYRGADMHWRVGPEEPTTVRIMLPIDIPLGDVILIPELDDSDVAWAWGVHPSIMRPILSAYEIHPDEAEWYDDPDEAVAWHDREFGMQPKPGWRDWHLGMKPPKPPGNGVGP